MGSISREMHAKALRPERTRGLQAGKEASVAAYSGSWRVWRAGRGQLSQACGLHFLTTGASAGIKVIFCALKGSHWLSGEDRLRRKGAWRAGSRGAGVSQGHTEQKQNIRIQALFLLMPESVLGENFLKCGVTPRRREAPTPGPGMAAKAARGTTSPGEQPSLSSWFSAE